MNAKYTKVIAKKVVVKVDGRKVDEVRFNVAAVDGPYTYIHFIDFKSEEYALHLKNRIDATPGFTPANKPLLWKPEYNPEGL